MELKGNKWMKLPKFNVNIYFIEVSLILLVGLIPLLWYKQGSIALGHDMGFPLAPVDYFKDRLFTWSDRIGSFGSNQTDSISGIFIHGLEALFSSLGFSLIEAQKLTFIFWFVLPGITMHTLLKSLHPKKEEYVIRISGSLFYMLNHFLLQAWLIAERTKFSLIAVLPLIVLIIINVIIRKKNILWESIKLCLFLIFLNGGAGIPLWGGVAVVGVCTFVISLIYSSEKWVKKLLRAISFILISLIFLILANLYWIYPYINSFEFNFTQRFQSAGGIDGILGWSRDISRNASFANILRMQGIPEWYGNPNHPYARVFLGNPIFILLSFLFPLLAFFGVIKHFMGDKLHKLYTTTFLAILVVGIPFVAGSHAPFGFIYDFLLKELPGFSIFRTPYYKFGMVIWFAYTYLVAVGLYTVANYLCKSNFLVTRVNLSEQKFKAIILCIFILALTTYNFPFFTGSFFKFSKSFSTMVKVPDYVFNAKEELDKNLFSTRTLLLPELDSNLQEKYTWEYFSLSTIPSMLSRRPVVINDVIIVNSPERKLTESLYEQLQKTGDSQLIRLLGIDRVLFRSDTYYQKDTSYSPEKTLTSFKNSDAFALTKKYGKWEHYSYIREDVKPLISAPSSLIYLSVNSSDIDKIFEIPGLNIGNSFILQDPKSEFNPAYLDNTTNLVLQALCTNCPSLQETYEVKLLIPRILPGTRLYPLSKFLDKRRRAKLDEPTEIIENDLIAMSKRAGALWVLVKDYKTAKPIGLIIGEWKDLLEDIKIVYNQLPTPQLKNHYSYKTYYLLRKILFTIEDLVNEDRKNYVLDQESKEALNQFRPFIESYINEVGLGPVDVPLVGTPSRYKLYIPKDDKYQISLFTAQPYLTSENNLVLKVNGNELKLNKDEKEGWFISDPIQLNLGETVVDFPLEDSNFKDLSPIKDFKIEAATGRSKCMELPIGKIDPKGNYTVKFDYNISSGAIPFFFYVLETNSEFPEGKVSELIGDGRVGYERNGHFQKVYKPGILTESIFIRFCADALEREPALIDIKNFQILAHSPHSSIFLSTLNDIAKTSTKVEYISLNQTKYLVRIEGFPKKWFIDFNSRFDNNWKIRLVNKEVSNGYFKGEKKEYLGGKVIEYARLDKHLITDLIFPSVSGNINKEHLLLNSFSNGWYISSEENSQPVTLLIEYNSQNDLYKTAAISLIAILILVSMYIGRRIYERVVG